MAIYSQKQLEAMTDFELTVVAAGYFLPCDYIINKEKKVVELANYQDVMNGDVHDQVLTPYDEYNPTENWRDCGALIDECGITTKATRCTEFIAWFAMDSNKMGLSVLNKNDPKRAVTIAYILIKQGQ